MIHAGLDALAAIDHAQLDPGTLVLVLRELPAGL
jgi:hypothetical protein